MSGEEVVVKFYARVGDSEVLNELGRVGVNADVALLPVPNEAGATRQYSLDLPTLLRRLAADLDQVRDYSPREIIQRVIDYTETCDIGTQKAADALTDEICAALGLPAREETT